MTSNEKTILHNGFGLGVDLISTARFKNLNRKTHQKFLDKIFTDKELDYCFAKYDPSQHLAARFAAKEAILKSLASMGYKYPPLNQIEILNSNSGVPLVQISCSEFSEVSIKISLSHSEDTAIAFCSTQARRNS